MRHRKDGRQFGRNTSHRRAMFRNMAANLVTHERIVTTAAKAKELRRVTEKLITKAKRLGPVAYTPQADLSDADKAKRLHVHRLLAAFLPRWGVTKDGTKQDLIEKVMLDLAKRYDGRQGGYTRIIKLGPRRGDGADMSVIELLAYAETEAARKPEKEDATKAAPAAPAEEAATEEEATEEATEEESTDAEAEAEAADGEDDEEKADD